MKARYLGYIAVHTEDDDNTVIIDDSEMEDTENGPETQGKCDGRYVTHLAYEGNEDLLDIEEQAGSQENLSTSAPRLSRNPEQMELVYLRKRRRLASSLTGMRAKEPEYEDGDVIYEYDPDDECGSVVSEASCAGDQQKTLMEVLNYCQAMYDAILKLDEKFESLHRKVSEMQHTRLKPLLLKPRPLRFTYRSPRNLLPGKIRIQKATERKPSQILLPGHGCQSQPMKAKLQRAPILTRSAVKPVPHTLQPESQPPVHRQSPPLPTIVSTRSLCPPFNMASDMPNIPSQTNLATLVNESSVTVASLAIASPVVSSVASTPPAANLERNNRTVTNKTSPGSRSIRNEPPSSSSVSASSAVASSRLLNAPVTANKMPNLPSQASLSTTQASLSTTDSPAQVESSAVPSPLILPQTSLERKKTLVTYRTSTGGTDISNEVPSSSSMSHNFEFIGDPKRNVKVLGNYLMKAWQKTVPKHAARYLVRVLFPKETLLCSVMGTRARGRRTLDPNKIAAIREFLAAYFPTYDLSEHGKDWKTCITNVNAMIRCLRYESKTSPITEGKEKAPEAPDTSMCVDLIDIEEESDINSQTSSISNQLQNSTGDNNKNTPSSSEPPSLEPMAHLGNPSRNVQLPFSVIFAAKGKTRPELSARYLIRHLFTENILIKSNVYGNLDRGTHPLDCNKINALRDFLQETYPSFELKETGYDWKACVAAINSTIRSLRFDHKKASSGVQSKVSAKPPPLSRSSKCSL